MWDIIFVLNGIEKVRYDLENEFKGERQATRELVAYENNVNIEDIKLFKQKRNKFNVLLFRNFSLYGEFENLDYKNTFSIISECINNKNNVCVKVDNKIITIQNNTHFRYFIEEFGPQEI